LITILHDLPIEGYVLRTMADSEIEISRVCAEPSQVAIDYDKLDVNVPYLREIVEARKHKLAEEKRQRDRAVEEAETTARMKAEAHAKVRAEKMASWITDYMLTVLTKWHEDEKLQEMLISNYVEGQPYKLLESKILKEPTNTLTTIFGEESQKNNLTWGHIADYMKNGNIIHIINEISSPYYGCALLFECKVKKEARYDSQFTYRYFVIGIKLLMSDQPYHDESEVPGYVKSEKIVEQGVIETSLKQCCIVM
jgi:hypothetical protein